MIVYFIGGPRDGEREVVERLHGDRIKVAVSPPLAPFVPGTLPPMTVAYDEVEYRVFRRTPRYVVAEYVAPRIVTRWSVKVRVAIDRPTVLEAFRRWILERQTPPRHDDVRWTGAVVACGDEADLEFGVMVDGPADPLALAQAGELLQRWLDRARPEGVRIVEAAGEIQH